MDKLVLFVCLLGAIGWANTNIIGPNDFCQWDTFVAECQPDEVVVMVTATYGRMELGKCVRNDLGYVGCSNDVIDVTDKMCSGKQKCNIEIPNSVFDGLKSKFSCLEDLVAYFAASYRCQPVVKGTLDDCTIPNSNGNSRGFISNTVAMDTACGSHDNPWVIAGESGQKINIYLRDYSHSSADTFQNSIHTQADCRYKYAVLEEENAQQQKLVCSTGRNYSHVYTSVGNVLRVRMHTSPYLDRHRNKEDKHYYLLEYQVVGCPDPPVSEDAWVTREGDTVRIGCHGGSEQWTLTCVAGQWTHSDKKCPDGRKAATNEVIIGNIKLPSGLSIAIIIVISLMIGCVILGVGMLFLKRQQNRQNAAAQRRSAEDQVYKSTAYSEYSRTVHDNQANDRNHGNAKPGSREANEYASIWEWPLPAPPVETSGSATKPEVVTVPGYGYSSGYQRSYRDDNQCDNGDKLYQLPDCDQVQTNPPPNSSKVTSNEQNPRYFELDPQDGNKSTAHACGRQPSVRTGTGPPPPCARNDVPPPSPRMNHAGHYSN